MFEEIIEKNLKRIEKDLTEIEGLQKIDFVDIFPTSEEHKKQLDDEVSKKAKILQKTERGNVYLLNQPIKTKYGELRHIKIRYFDETRLNWEAAADFVVKDRNVLMNKVGKDSRYSYIKRPKWDAIEFKTDNTLIYFLNPLASEVYGNNMSEIVKKIKEELLKRCETYKEKHGYDFWNDHIKYVVKNSVELAKKYDADIEIVELGALLHDIAMPSEIGPREEHNIYGVKIADELLTQLNYPEDRKERVKECVLRHRGSTELPRNTVEEQCVADADVIAHFDCIPSLFHLAFGKNENDMSIEAGTEFVKKKLERDYSKLSDRTKEEIKERYENIIKVLFVQK